MRVGFGALRSVTAVVIAAAIIAQLIASVSFVGPTGKARTLPVTINFFSYFTIDSNTLAVIVLAIGALTLLRGGISVEPKTLTMARAAITSYMIITGVVYNLLLRGALIQGATVAWSNEILHVVGPIYLLLDWFLAPGRHRLRIRDALPTLIFPTVWVAYTSFAARSP